MSDMDGVWQGTDPQITVCKMIRVDGMDAACENFPLKHFGYVEHYGPHNKPCID